MLPKNKKNESGKQISSDNKDIKNKKRDHKQQMEKTSVFRVYIRKKY